jgi:hypothetical protein
MDVAQIVTLRVDDEHLEFNLPPGATAEEIGYLKTLLPRVAPGIVELLDPDTHEVVLTFYKPTLH